MKKVISLLLALVLILSLAACGKNNTEDPAVTEDPTASPTVTKVPDKDNKNNKTDDPKTTAEPSPEPSSTVAPSSAPTASPAPSATPAPKSTPKPTTAPTSTPKPSDSGSAFDDDVNSFSSSVEEDGEDIIVTVMDETPLGKAICKMIYDYNNNYLIGITAIYELPSEELAKSLMEELEKEDTVEKSAIKLDGTSVSFSLGESDVEQFREISRNELFALLKTAINLQ